MLVDGVKKEIKSKRDLVTLISSAEVFIIKCIPRDDSGNIIGEPYEVEIRWPEDKEFDMILTSVKNGLHDN